MEPLQELPTNPLAPSPEPSSSKNARLQKRQAVSPSTPYLRLSIGGARKGQIVVTAGAMTKEELWMFRKRVESVKRLNSELMSEQMSLVTKLKVANDFKDKPRFYLPHNIDFRGRAYPLHPNLNQLGNDFSRSLLLFADAKPLGKSGLNWLKIQLANGWGQGQDKLALDGRIAFVDQHLADVTDSATHPLDGARWWASGEKPLQVLAVCMELHQALTSPDPEKFLSSLPVHQDGTCNGLQHYAALGRDVGGATAVNLKNADKPQDVYMAVAKLVEDKVSKYLSTITPASTGEVSKYLANITIMSIGEVFQNAQAIMQWLGICASAVTATKRPVRWDSPLGFPIEQPYWKEKMSVSRPPSVLCGLDSPLGFPTEAAVLEGNMFEVTGHQASCVFGQSPGFPTEQPYWKENMFEVTATKRPVCSDSPLGFPTEQPYWKENMLKAGGLKLLPELVGQGPGPLGTPWSCKEGAPTGQAGSPITITVVEVLFARALAAMACGSVSVNVLNRAGL
eukprot:gene18056-24479_t